MYMVALVGVAYNQDNKTVFQHIKDCTLGEPAFEWIHQFENSNVGKAVIKALRDHFEGMSQVDKWVMPSERVISLGPEGVSTDRWVCYSIARHTKCTYIRKITLGVHSSTMTLTPSINSGLRSISWGNMALHSPHHR